MTFRFSYEAFTAGGKRVSGRIEAETLHQAHDKLLRQSLIPSAIMEDSRAAATVSFWRRDIRIARRVGPEARAAFLRELGLLLKAGIALDRSLRLMAGQARASRLGATIERVRERIVSGQSLQAALGAEAGFFEPDEIAMIGAGERSGDIVPLLADVAAALERRGELAARLSSALVYPAILLAMSLVALGVIMTVLVPNLLPLFENARTEPPLLVGALLALSRVIEQHGSMIAAACLALVAGLWFLSRQEKVALRLGSWMFRLPYVGPIAAELDTARFARSLACLIRSGAPLLQALAAAGGACRNPAARGMIARVAARVASGQRVAAALEEFAAMPAATRQFIAIGEEANRLEDMLLHAAQSNETAAYRRIERSMTALTPLLTLAIGGLIGGLIVAVMRAILSVNDLAFQ